MNERAREFRAMRRVTLPESEVQAREKNAKRLNEIIKNSKTNEKNNENYRERTRRIKNICYAEQEKYP